MAAIFVPSIGLEYIIAHIEALTKFIQKTLSNSQQSLSLLNTEMSLMRRDVLQNRRALDITAWQKGTCAIIQTECFVSIPNESVNMSFLNHSGIQGNALSDRIPHPDRLRKINGLGHGFLDGKSCH